ncbi:hypothetical protein Pisl_0742 [Pyrobaculum islandicum DSM 4184]|uniref:Uncharacterized protein n=1 Tax=Pyrobaculum islandicum (strain DSM 4184 / JCM 9189 / GEO3) TaxID=384616 RepID=A1RSI7_PYRIL|nr:hypothetical protein [Pyrobaculum islandicum]ABL87919.1 hypothetical protein Pisl_0742 [Pyrobaculum islandicum DSM 4184]
MKRLVTMLVVSTAAVALLLFQLMLQSAHRGELGGPEPYVVGNAAITQAIYPYARHGGISPAPYIYVSTLTNLTLVAGFANVSLHNRSAVALSNTSIVDGFGAAYYVAISAGEVSGPPPWAVALGGAGVALYGYGLYLSLCRGPLCSWRRFKALRFLSAAAVATSLALLYVSPLYLALSIPGAWGIVHYYRARRRLVTWLSSTLT